MKVKAFNNGSKPYQISWHFSCLVIFVSSVDQTRVWQEIDCLNRVWKRQEGRNLLVMCKRPSMQDESLNLWVAFEKGVSERAREGVIGK